MKKELEKKQNWNNRKGVDWRNLVLKICLLPAILMLNIARAILTRTKDFNTSLIKILTTVFTIFLMISTTISIATAIPTTINLQGKLMSDSGSSLTGTHNLTFKIYDAYTDGNLLYEDENNVTLNSRGVYDVTLRDVNLSFDEDYYLGIKVNTNSEMTPRINLSSMPYAFRANISDDLNKNNSYTIGILNVTNNITIGDSAEDLITVTSSKFNVSSVGNLDIAGNLTLAKKITFALGEIIDNILDGWIRITGGLNVTNDIILGTSSSNNLTVNAYIASDLIPVDNARDLGSPANFWKYLYVDELIANNLSGGAMNISGTTANSFVIDSDNPTNDEEDISLVYERGTPTTNAVITWDSTDKRFEFNKPVYLEEELIMEHNASINNTLYVVNEKVGINTTTPQNTLNIVGDLNVTGTSYLSDITISADNITTNGIISKDGNIGFFNSTGSEKVRITQNGNVGIGTTTPTQKLEVNGHINVTGTTSNSTFAGDVTIEGTLYGGSPLKVGNGLNVTSGDLTIANGNITDNNGTVLTTPADMIAIFDTDCPTGWTRVTALDDKFLVANSTYSAARGGNDSITLSVDNLASHTHAAGTLTGDGGGNHDHSFSDTVSQYSSYYNTAHTHTVSGTAASNGAHVHAQYTWTGSADDGAGRLFVDWAGGDPGTKNTVSAGAHTHSVSGTAASNGANHRHDLSDYTASGDTNFSAAHTHTISGSTGAIGSGTVVDNRPAFATVVICKKDVGSDYAEWIKSKEHYKPGTIVSADPNAAEQIKISEKSYDSAVLGVVSTAPGWIVGRENDNSLMMALSGRVPTIVSVKNEAIKPGDAITTSEIAGIGMKATKPGSIIGKALESFEPKECKDISSLKEITWLEDTDCFKIPDNTYIGKIIVFVSVSYWEPENYEEEQNDKIETNTGSIVELKQQIQAQQSLLEKQEQELEQLKSLVCLDHPEADICNTVTTSHTISSAITEYEVYVNDNIDLKNALKEQGHKVTRIERSNGVKEGFESLPGNYALVTIEREGLTKLFEDDRFKEYDRISESVLPYLKDYYPDPDMWMIYIHDTNPEGKQALCTSSIPELSWGGCTETSSWDLIFREEEVDTTESVEEEIVKEETKAQSEEQQKNIVAETTLPTQTPEKNVTEFTNQTEPINECGENNTSIGWYNIVNTMTATITSSGLINYITLFLLI